MRLTWWVAGVVALGVAAAGCASDDGDGSFAYEPEPQEVSSGGETTPRVDHSPSPAPSEDPDPPWPEERDPRWLDALTSLERVPGEGGPGGIGACRVPNPEGGSGEGESLLEAFTRARLVWVELDAGDLRTGSTPYDFRHGVFSWGESLGVSSDDLDAEAFAIAEPEYQPHPVAVGEPLPVGYWVFFDATAVQDLDDVATDDERVLVGFEAATIPPVFTSSYVALVRGDDVHFVGHCRGQVTTPLAAYAEATGRTQVETLEAVIADRDEMEALHALAHPPEPSLEELWFAADPRERSVGFGDEPQWVTDSLAPVVIAIDLPDAWRDIDESVCTWTDEGWNGCVVPSLELDPVARADSAGPAPVVVLVDPDGVLEVWLQTDDYGRTAGVQLGEIAGAVLVDEWIAREEALGGGIPPILVRISDDATSFDEVVSTADSSPPTLTFDLVLR